MANPARIRLAHPLAAIAVLAGSAGERKAQPVAGDASTVNPSDAQGNSDDRLQRGMQERLDAELSELCSAKEALKTAAGEFQELRQRFLQEAEQQLLDLSIDIARKVLMQEIQTERYEIDPIVREAMSKLSASVDVELHLNPKDLARCELAKEGGQATGGDVRFIADPNVQPAECRLHTSQGIVESSIEGHLKEIGNALRNPE